MMIPMNFFPNHNLLPQQVVKKNWKFCYLCLFKKLKVKFFKLDAIIIPWCLILSSLFLRKLFGDPRNLLELLSYHWLLHWLKFLLLIIWRGIYYWVRLCICVNVMGRLGIIYDLHSPIATELWTISCLEFI